MSTGSHFANWENLDGLRMDFGNKKSYNYFFIYRKLSENNDLEEVFTFIYILLFPSILIFIKYPW